MEFAEKDIQEICDNENLNIVQIKVGLILPSRVFFLKFLSQVFPPKDSKVKTSSGIIEFTNSEEAIKALVLLNHRKYQKLW